MAFRQYRTIFLRQIHIRSGCWKIVSFCLHHHLTGLLSLRPHRHAYSQLLLFLSGSGQFRLGSRTYNVEPGCVVFIPSQCAHSFKRQSKRPPFTLVIDFHWQGGTKKKATVAKLSATHLSHIRRHLCDIARIEKLSAETHGLMIGSRILEIVDSLLQAGHQLPPIVMSSVHPVVQKAENILLNADNPFLSLWEISQKIGFQQDHLNRILKQHAGTTLGGLRNQMLLKKARQLLHETQSVGSAATKLGFVDVNYFSRWFRKLTGMTPMEFRKHSP